MVLTCFIPYIFIDRNHRETYNNLDFYSWKCTTSSFLVWYRNGQKKVWVGGCVVWDRGAHTFFLTIPIPDQKAGSCALPWVKIPGYYRFPYDFGQ